MRFSNIALTLIAALVVGPSAVTAFTGHSTTFLTKSPATSSGAVISSSKPAGCSCGKCNSSTVLSMSESATEEEAPATEEIPSEVVALDGIASEEEAHNTDRPARGSGIHKHKKGGEKGKGLSELEVGSTVEGTVKTITSYGAFVDIGAATDALLHVSRLSEEFVSNVEDVVKAGDSITVRIAEVNAEKGQVALSMLSEEAEKKVQEARSGGGRRKSRPQRSGGDRSAQLATIAKLDSEGLDTAKFVEGEVVSTLDFGAFVRFDASQLTDAVTGELDGLVHISALSEGRTENVNSVVSVGDKVNIRVRQLDVEGGKVSLSMITPEQEEASRPTRDRKPRRRGRQMFSEDEMGAKDWKESLQKFQEDNEGFTNTALIVDKRK